MLEPCGRRPPADSLIAEFSRFLSGRMGLHFPPERRADLERGLAAAARELGFTDTESCIRSLLASAFARPQLETLASHLTVGETYFFRERPSFECLEAHVLPALVRDRRAGERRLRIWSAGCATGEEPYSIAMALARAIPDLSDWNVSILATDINPRALRKASLGIYGDWSFRDAPAGIRETFFARTKDGRFEIAERIRSMVSFGYLNLAEDGYPSVENATNAMDIVFCRNVLMYFDPAHGRKALEKLGRSLMNDGWLFVNPVEMPQTALPQLVTVNLPGTIAYRKGARLASAEPERAAMPAWLSGAPVLSQALADVAAAIELPQMAPQGGQPTVCAPTPYQQAAALYALGRYPEAAETLRQALARDPGDAAAMALLARSCANQGDLAEAAKWCKQAVAADKLNSGWHYLLATIVQEQGAAEEAAAALRRALYLDQDYALAHFALGNLFRRQGRRMGSERHYRNALAVLGGCAHEQVLPESEGITAGRLAEIIRASLSSEASA
ncbi:MAG: tetratricopeptide repeat protein [Betaproteobacteria bacterium]|nr:MAG: tetratricopeptide repeat protein [Betaproteobacteria bacterium]